MAESILKLKVDNQEYNAKIDRARQGLLAMEQACRKVGGTLEVVEQADLDFVKSIGQMSTTSNTARGKVNELTKAFTDLQSQYNRLTDDEKSSPFGKALAQSLDQLKTRIKEGNAELKNIQGELGNAGGGLQDLAGKFGLNLGQMAKFTTAGAAVAGALKVAKDAFFASEENLDAWNRVVEQSEAVYNGFLTSLNTGDISGFISRIDQIKQAAKEAYDELDRLGTQKAMDNKSLKTQQTENERMRAMLRTGRYIAPLDGRANAAGLKNGDKLTKEQLEKLAENLGGGLQKVNRIYESEIRQTSKSIEALYKKEAVNLGMSSEAFKKGTADMQAFDKVIAGYMQYKEFEAAHTSSVTMQSTAGAYTKDVRDNEKNPYEKFKAWGTFLDDGETFTKINDLINQRSSLMTQQYNAHAQAYRSMNKVDGGGSKIKTSTKTDITYDEGSIGAMEQKIAELGKQLKATTSQEVRDGLLEEIKQCNKQLDVMRGKFEKLGKDEQATFTMQLNADQLAELEKMLPKDGVVTETVNIEPGKIDVPELPKEGEVTTTLNFKVDDQEAYQKLQKYVNLHPEINATMVIDTKQNIHTGLSGLSTAAFSEWKKYLQDEMATVDITTPLYQNLQAQIADTTALQNLVKTAVENGINLKDVNLDAEGMWDKILNAEDISDADWQGIVDSINEKLKELKIDPIKLNVKTGNISDLGNDAKASADEFRNAAQAVTSMGVALSSIEDPGAKVAGMIANAVASIAMAFANASVNSSKGGVFGWIAATTAGIATMTSTIAAIKTATEYHADGGFVGGGPRGTDTINTWLTPGELVLNAAQQQNLADNLQSSSDSTHESVHPYVTGQHIYLGLNNYLKGVGKGQIVTSK